MSPPFPLRCSSGGSIVSATGGTRRIHRVSEKVDALLMQTRKKKSKKNDTTNAFNERGVLSFNNDDEEVLTTGSSSNEATITQSSRRKRREDEEKEAEKIARFETLVNSRKIWFVMTTKRKEKRR